MGAGKWLLFLFSVVAPLIAAEPVQKPLTDEQRILHALNRLTYGPMPGDVERVEQIGLDKWIEKQLHPDTIPENPLLADKLQPLDSLRMSTAELVQAYPPPQVIRAVAEGRMEPPDDPVVAAVIERLAQRRAAQQQGDAAVRPSRADLVQTLTPEGRRALRQATPDEVAEQLEAMDPERLAAVLPALGPRMRQILMEVARAKGVNRILFVRTPQQLVLNDLLEGKIYRAVYSNRQLEEVLTDFWFNHFNVYLNKGPVRYLTPSYERDAIRPYVLGKFGDMLLATARSPAMLFYLDNFQSVDPNAAERMPRRVRQAAAQRLRGLNENYARELMELHTLGVDGGYTQQDVIEVARCFTGWSIREPRGGTVFEFHPRLHDPGEKTVLGHTIPAGGGMEDGLRVIEILVSHPSTARFISTKLAQRFVADEPPEELIERMAATFRETEGDLREVMRTMLSSPEFFSAENYRAKVKSPLETVVSAARAMDADVRSAGNLATAAEQMGEALYRKEEPNGYPETGEAWLNSSALVARLNFAEELASNRMSGVVVDSASLGGDTEGILATVLGEAPSGETLKAINDSLDGRTATPELAAGLALGLPEFQRR